jgi:hypothetical protein
MKIPSLKSVKSNFVQRRISTSSDHGGRNFRCEFRESFLPQYRYAKAAQFTSTGGPHFSPCALPVGKRGREKRTGKNVLGKLFGESFEGVRDFVFILEL